MEQTSPLTVKDVADRLGRVSMAAALGVGATAVSNAVVRDKQFPAAWFVVLSEMARVDGFDLPARLCGMKTITTPIVDDGQASSAKMVNGTIA